MTNRNSATRVERADHRASRTVNRKRDSWPMRAIGAVSDIGDQPQMRLLCAAVMAAGLIRRDSRLLGTGMKMLAAHTVATWAKSGVKGAIDRTRPESGDDPKLQPGDSDAREDNSFPSGHSAGAVAVAQALARSYPQHALHARAAALVIAAVQVPRGTHYVGDVVAGTAIGLAAERASEALIDTGLRGVEAQLRSRRHPRPPADPRPGREPAPAATGSERPTRAG